MSAPFYFEYRSLLSGEIILVDNVESLVASTFLTFPRKHYHIRNED